MVYICMYWNSSDSSYTWIISNILWNTSEYWVICLFAKIPLILLRPMPNEQFNYRTTNVLCYRCLIPIHLYGTKCFTTFSLWITQYVVRKHNQRPWTYNRTLLIATKLSEEVFPKTVRRIRYGLEYYSQICITYWQFIAIILPFLHMAR